MASDSNGPSAPRRPLPSYMAMVLAAGSIVVLLWFLQKIVTALLLARYTRWGNQFRRMAWPYFDPRRTVIPLSILALLLLLTIFWVNLKTCNQMIETLLIIYFACIDPFEKGCKF
jgi:hypothetical protein